MYIPKINKVEDYREIFHFVRANNFGILVNSMDNLPLATHIPMELTEEENGHWSIQCHIAKANPQWKCFEKNEKTLAIFTGPHAYCPRQGKRTFRSGIAPLQANDRKKRSADRTPGPGVLRKADGRTQAEKIGGDQAPLQAPDQSFLLLLA